MPKSKQEYQQFYSAISARLQSPYFDVDAKRIKLHEFLALQNPKSISWEDILFQDLANHLTDEDAEIARLTRLAIRIKILAYYPNTEELIRDINRCEQREDNTLFFSGSSVASLSSEAFYLYFETLKQLKTINLALCDTIDDIDWSFSSSVTWNRLFHALIELKPIIRGIEMPDDEYDINQVPSGFFRLLCEMIGQFELNSFEMNILSSTPIPHKKLQLLFTALEKMQLTLRDLTLEFKEPQTVARESFHAYCQLLEKLPLNFISMRFAWDDRLPEEVLNRICTILINKPDRLKIMLLCYNLEEVSEERFKLMCAFLKRVKLVDLSFERASLHNMLPERLRELCEAINYASLSTLNLSDCGLERLDSQSFEYVGALIRNPKLKRLITFEWNASIPFYKRLFAEIRQSTLQEVIFARYLGVPNQDKLVILCDTIQHNHTLIKFDERTYNVLPDAAKAKLKQNYDFPRSLTGIGMVLAQLGMRSHVVSWMLEWVVGRPLRNVEHLHVLRVSDYMHFFRKKAAEVTHKRVKTCSP